MTKKTGQRLFLVDGTGLVFRAHYAFLRRPLTTSSGQHVGALFGFINTLLALIREEQATHLGVAFDTKEPTFRHVRYPAYKAHRPEPPVELIGQFPLVSRLTDAMGLATMIQPGVEADDLIGSMAREAVAAGWEAVIVSADKDFSQLIGPAVVQYIPSRGRDAPRWLDSDAIVEKYGVSPDQFIDYLALTGDSSDNIPGIRGIGPKTAATLLQEYGSVAQVYANVDAVTPPGTRKKLDAGRDDYALSRELVTIRTDVFARDPAEFGIPDPSGRCELKRFLDELEFSALSDRLFARVPVQASLLEPPAEDPFIEDGEVIVRDGWGAAYGAITTCEELDEILERRHGRAVLAIDTETDALDPQTANLVGVSLAWSPGEAWYLPIGHTAEKNLKLADVCRRLNPILSDEKLLLAGQNLKFDLRVLWRHGFEATGPYFDTMVASYLRDPDARHGLDPLVMEHLNHRMVPIETLIGRGREQRTMATVPLKQAAPYACEDVDAVIRLIPPFEHLLRAVHATELFETVEMPLLPVLARMESAGIALEQELLAEMATKLAAEIERAEAGIQELAGEEFNINSPKQLQVILFDRLKLKPTRKTKTGFSTSQEVLEELAGEHPLPRRILAYRQLSKLQSTYVEALPRLVNPETGRIHTDFHQTVTATGRLSSSNPNLQNIPIRTAMGREIRKAFVAPPGCVLLSADYSQIELRLLAHFSEDAHLVAAFHQGADIHRATAARVFGVPEDQVTPEMRSRAKVVNFGLLYGMGPRRLSSEQGISIKEASAFIADYFEKLPGVKGYMERVVAEARSKGYAETLLGRRRYLPDLQSGRHQARAAAERMAVNTQIQGSAADLIKLAMVRAEEELARAHPQARLLLQVHDELLLEVPAPEVASAGRILGQAMTGIAQLRVPLAVETGSGRTWFEAHA